MDDATLKAYDSQAAAFARDWHDQPAPTDLHDIVKRFFVAGSVADIGCGSGREVAWLAARGFAAQGYDASDGLLAEARRRYPALAFHRAELPGLAAIASDSFDNVLCETVIMHLATNEVVPSVRRLLDVVRPGGVLYLSWRVTPEADLRDSHRRLYSAFDAGPIRRAFDSAAMLLDEEVTSASSGKIIHRMVVRKKEAS